MDMSALGGVEASAMDGTSRKAALVSTYSVSERERFAEWLLENVWGDEEEIGDCHLAPVPILYGKRVMYCFPDRDELVRFPHPDLAKLAYEEAKAMVEAAHLLWWIEYLEERLAEKEAEERDS